MNDPGKRNVTYDELVAAYTESTHALIEGGADIILIETIFDTLNAKAAAFAVDLVFEELGYSLPVMISGTITDASGRTLSGQTTEAFYHSLRHVKPVSFGLNCALGPDELRQYVEELSRISETHVSAHPNAGLPNAFGEYDLDAVEMAEHIREWASSGFLNLVGGCCGTTPTHIRAMADAVAGIKPRALPDLPVACRLSGLEPLIITADSMFVNVGERTNVTGSAKFKRLIKEGSTTRPWTWPSSRWRTAPRSSTSTWMRDAGRRGGHGALPEPHRRGTGHRPGAGDDRLLQVGGAGGGPQVRAGQAGGQLHLHEGGEDKFIEQAKLLRRYGAAVIVMAFDEVGQADTRARKFEICQRAYRILVDRVGFPPEDIIFDPNIFAVATGIDEHNNYAVDFIEAVKDIKTHLPHAMISGGVSNVSFSFRGNEPVREAIHAVFLYHAIRNGMDMGIVNAGQLAIYEDIPPSSKRRSRRWC